MLAFTFWVRLFAITNYPPTITPTVTPTEPVIRIILFGIYEQLIIIVIIGF